MKLPHSLRVIIFLLRIALGLDFFYLGFSALFNPALGTEIRARSFGNLYSWLATAPSGSTGIAGVAMQGSWIQPLAQWAFLIIGACLIVGLFTRLASILGIMLTLFSYLPTISYTALGASQFINDEVIIVICLLILIFASAGKYFGLDTFIHIGGSKKT